MAFAWYKDMPRCVWHYTHMFTRDNICTLRWRQENDKSKRTVAPGGFTLRYATNACHWMTTTTTNAILLQNGAQRVTVI